MPFYIGTVEAFYEGINICTVCVCSDVQFILLGL